MMVYTGPLTIEQLIAHEDKLYFDRKACASAFLKGFIYGALTVTGISSALYLAVLAAGM